MRHRAFTLVELLIVVAIIAILAAIAVPNFIEAQTRAKVSRAKADMRSVTTAIEAYRVDSAHYALAVELENPAAFVIAGSEEVIEALVPFTLTTPIAYLTTLQRDPFPPNDEGLGGGESVRSAFHYLDRYTTEQRGEPATLDDFHEKLYGTRDGSTAWWMFSLGPDLDHDEDLTGAEPNFETALYDPTNGSVSSGDIFLFQGKSFAP